MPWIMAPSMKPIMPVRIDRLGVDPGVVHAGHVVEGEAVEPLHDQDPRA